MTTGKDIASFFENGTTEQFDYCFKMYPKVLQLKAEKRNKKPQELVRLDQWYQNELPNLIKGRGKDAHVIYDELVQTMKWKQSRGKSYPQLNYLVKVNTPRAVMQETKKAFRKLPNLEQAITALSNLKGVGTTMASALLAAAAPDSAPFMADECLMAIPEIEGIDYTTKEYLNFVQHIQNTVQRLNTQAGGEKPLWSAHRVELALWSHYVANELSPELLEDMPGPGSGHAANNTNGSANAKPKTEIKAADGGGGGGGEDTNDGDDESLGGAVEQNDANKTTTNKVSVNTGALQDGDSNFISNDSTSQEPIIDENTTQTTATTSTDDCEVGTTTPLASDSESNIEAPSMAKNGGGGTVVATVAAAAPATIVAAANSTSIDDTTLALPKKTSNNSNSTNSNSNSNNNNNNGSSDKLHTTTDGEAVVVASTTSEDTPMAVGNGNGTLLANASSLGGADSLDGENSSCLRSSANEGASEYDDDDDDEDDEDDDRNADESSNSNSRNVVAANDGVGAGDADGVSASVKVTDGLKSPIKAVSDGNNTNAATENNVEKDSTANALSNNTTNIGQKRSALQCIGGDGVDDDGNSESSEVKKLRRD